MISGCVGATWLGGTGTHLMAVARVVAIRHNALQVHAQNVKN
jgi:hypothetical protein